jgi:hypothetical protein
VLLPGLQDKGVSLRAAQVARALDTLAHGLTELADVGVRSGGRLGEEVHDAAMVQVSAVQCTHTGVRAA